MRPSHRRHNAMWPRRRYCGRAVSVLSMTKLLKECFPRSGSPEMVRPWPYKLAKDCGWITADAYYDVEPVPTGRTHPGIERLLYQESPFFGLIKRESFTSQETA